MVSVESQGAVSVVMPDGALNAESAEDLAAAVGQRLGGGQPLVVLDLSATPLVDSIGLEAVLDARDTVRNRGGIIKLAGPPPLLEDVLHATGVGEKFEVFPSAKSAVGSFSR